MLVVINFHRASEELSRRRTSSVGLNGMTMKDALRYAATNPCDPRPMRMLTPQPKDSFFGDQGNEAKESRPFTSSEGYRGYDGCA